MTAAQLIRTRLVNDAGVSALISDRVYLHALQPDCAYPAVAMVAAGDTPINDLDGEDAMRKERWQLDCWATSFADVEAAAAAVMTAMGTAGVDFTAVRLSGSPQFEDASGLHRILLEYSITY